MQEAIFPGAVGRIEGRYLPAEEPTAPSALFLHPHPNYGGSMNNRVVHAMFLCMREIGFSCLKINFRGVGRSEGHFEGTESGIIDAAIALDWLQNQSDTKETWVVGYAFGVWVGMQLLMRRPEVGAFVSVSPPCHEYDFNFLAPCPNSGLIITAEKDELIPLELVNQLARKLAQQPNIKVSYSVIADANHQYSQHHAELKQAFYNYFGRIGMKRVSPVNP